LNPALKKGGRAVGGGGGRERNSLRPSGGPIDDCEQVGETSRQQERAYQIDVEMRKTANWYRYVGGLKRHMAMNLPFLAMETIAGQSGNEHAHPGPTKPGGDQALCCLDAWVVNVVQR